MSIDADPYNWIFESNKNNNGLGMGLSQDTVCK